MTLVVVSLFLVIFFFQIVICSMKEQCKIFREQHEFISLHLLFFLVLINLITFLTSVCRFIQVFNLALATLIMLLMDFRGHFLDAFMMTKRFILLNGLR